MPPLTWLSSRSPTPLAAWACAWPEPPSEDELEGEWGRQRDLLQFIATELGGSYWVCEDEGEIVGYARVCRFGEMEELTELMVLPSHQGRGLGRALLERCWPGDPSPEMGRVVVAVGAAGDLSLYSGFGVMPTAGHWHLQARTAEYQESRSQEIDATEPGCACARGRPRGRGVEHAGAPGDRTPAPDAARVLLAQPHLPCHDGREHGSRHRPLLGRNTR